MAVAIRRAALAVGVTRQVRLELVEEPAPAFVNARRRQAVSARAGRIARGSPDSRPRRAGRGRLAPRRSSPANRRMSVTATSGPRPSPASQNMIWRISSRRFEICRADRLRGRRRAGAARAQSAVSTAAPTAGVSTVVSSSTSAGSQPTMNTRPAESAERLRDRERAGGDGQVQVDLARRLDDFTSETYTAAGRAAAGHRVDDDEAVVRSEQLLGEPDPSRADLHELDVRERWPLSAADGSPRRRSRRRRAERCRTRPRACARSGLLTGSTPMATRTSSPSTARERR